MSRYFRAKVTDNLPIDNTTYLLAVEPLCPVSEPLPGQFSMIQTGDSYDPLLKRPFCYLRSTAESIQFLYRVRGRGTSLMSAFKKGKVISGIGPLGNGYPLPRKNHIPLLVAGGTGIISLFSLIEKLTQQYHIFYGARNRDELLLLHELEKRGDNFTVCTNDCSFGKEGMVDEILLQFLDEHRASSKSFVIYSCGPKPMLRAVAGISREKGIKGYVSLEENMACGFGACLGCAVKTTKGYKKVCKEGPVFPIDEIVW